MSAALTPPFLVASLVLCLAGALKLRSPGVAAGALAALGLPGRRWSVRVLATGEIALGAVCALHPARALSVALTLLYATFAMVATILMRRRVACGCFGDDEFPVSLVHVIASGLLGAVALAASLTGVRGLGWVWGRPVPQTAVLMIGIAGALYATVLVYMLAPRAWGAWGSE
jgi:hypothetical protein